jgi:polysaccharide chain length determinant protein (PEP-CTERM system associated)
MIIVRHIPDFYRSETVIMVDPQTVSSSVVQSPVTSTIQDRLSTIEQQVMSPSRLERVIETQNLYPGLRTKVSDQDLVAKMQRATKIDVVNAGGRGLSTFKISFQSTDAKTSAKVANQLANDFIEANLRAREEQFTGTTDFLNGELQDTKKQLEAKEAEMGRIKSEFIMDLPESKQFHLEALTTLRNQLRDSQDRVSQDQQQKMMIQSMEASTNPAVDLDPDEAGASDSPTQREIQKVQTNLSTLRSHYGPNYPDVRKLQTDLDALKVRLAQEKSTGAAVAPPPPQKTAAKNPVLQAQLAKLDEEIATEQKRQPQMQEQIDFHSSKLEREPVFEQQMAGLMRDYDTLRAHYTSLLDRKLSAEMATQLEAKQQGERFVILDPAQVPDAPAGPNRALFTLGGILVGIFAGAALAVAVEMADETVRNEKEATQIAGKSVLAGIPEMLTRKQSTLNILRSVVAMAITVVVSVGVGYVLSGFATRFF